MRAVRLSLAFGATGSSSSSSSGGRSSTAAQNHHGAGNQERQSDKWTASSLGEARPRPAAGTPATPSRTNHRRLNNKRSSQGVERELPRQTGPSAPGPEQPRVFDESGKELARDAKGRLLALYNPRTKQLNRLFDEDGKEYVVHDITRNVRSHHAIGEEPSRGGPGGTSVRRELEVGEDGRDSEVFRKARSPEGSGATVGPPGNHEEDDRQAHQTIKTLLRDQSPSDESGASSTRALAAGAVASIPPGLTDGVVYADHDLPPVDGSESLLHDGSDNGPAPESTIKVSGIGDHATVQRKVDVRWSAAPRELVQEVVPIRPEDADDARDTRALEGREGTVGRTSAAVSTSSSETRDPEGASYTSALLLHPDSSSRTKAETRPTLPNEQAGGSSSSKATTSKAKPAEGAQGSSDPGLRQPFHKRLPADLRVREITPGVFVMDADSALEKDADRVQKLLQYSLHAGSDAKPIPKPTGSAVGIEVATEVHIGSSPDEVWASVRSVASFPKHLVASTLYSSSEVEGQGHHSDPPDVEATTASRVASTSEAPSPDDCFYGSSVCRECRGRQECLAKNQLNLNDYGVVGDDEGALVGKDAVDVRRIPVGEDGVSSSNDWMNNLSGPSDGSPGAEPAHRKSGAARSSAPATKTTKAKEPASSAGLYGNFVDTLDSWRSIGKQLVASLTERAQPAPEEFLAGLEASRARSRKLARRELAAERLLGIRPSGKKKNSKAESGVGYSEAGALEALSLETEEDSFRRRLDAELRARNALRLTPEAYAEILREVRSTPRFDEKSKNSNAGNNRRGRAPLQLALDRSRQEPAVRSGPHYLKRKLLTAAEEAAWKRSMEFTEECITAGGNSTRQLLADTSEIAPVSSWTSSWASSLASSFRPLKSFAADLREDGLGTARPRGVLADLERQLSRDRQARLREPGKELQASAETPQAQLQRRKMDRKKPLATLLTQQRRLQTYLKSTFTGQTDQCLCYHENNIFKPVLDLFPVKLPDFRECLTLHYAMGSSWQGVCTLEDACKYSSRIAAEMQLVAQPNQQCNCELCIWGEAWHATGQASASCPNNHAELWREICLPCKAESSIDIAAMSDADVPKRSRFEKIGTKGECVDKSLRFVRGRGGVVGSHLQCRDICWQTIGLDCLGYSYFHCSKRCIIHLQQSGMHKMSQWTKVKGEGDVIVGTDNTCGAECYRVTYGECPPGQIASGGVDVKWEERMVYGQSDVFVCPSPYTGQVTITCAGANSQTVEGMCMEPCPSGQLVYRPGLTPIAYPVTPIATRRRLPCPFDPQNAASNIELLCQSDRSILVVSPNCGASCAPGMYALKIGGGIISYSFMKHRQKVPLFDCPFGYVGKLDLICVDGQVQEQPTPDTGCFLHCNAKHDMNVDRTSTANATTDVQLRAEFDLNEAQWIGNPSRLYMNETLQLATMSTQFMEGIFFKHDSILNAPCKPSPLTYGFIQVKCSNGIISALGEACKFNCPAGSIEAGTGGHSLQMFHGYLEDWHSVDVVCPTAQWTGTVQLSCRNGLLSRRESDVCMRHCNVDYLVSNGLNIPMGMQLMHDSLTNVTCAAGGNPKFAGKLQVHCFNGAVNVIGRCGQFCASTMLISNDAMVLTYRQDHDETRGYPCPSPWTGTLILSCDDQNIKEEASCGQMCYASTHLVRGISNMPFPKAGDVAQGMIGIDHGKTYDAGCPVATDSLSYTGGLVLQCDNGEVTEHSGACFWNCDKLIVNSGGFPQTIDYLKHDTNDTFTCAAGLDTGYLVLRCFDQQLTIEKGSCAASPCPPGSVKAVATRDAALPHPLIFHLGQVTLTCPEPYTGTLTLACDNKAITFPFANCGNRCQVNGTIYPNTINTYGLPIYGGIKIYTPLMDHSTQVSLTCPANTKGTVTIECDDGTPKQVAGGCNNPCPPDMFVTPTGALIPLLYMEHGDVRTNIPCPVGTTMGGTIDVACVNGTYNRTQGVCLTNCPSRDFTSNTVEMRHPTIAHGQSYAADCGSWNPDYTGLIVVSCSEGAVTDSGRCSRHCPPGSVVSNGATVPYERILHGTQVNLTCSLANVGTIDFAHTLALGCNDGAVSIATTFQNGKANATGTCMRNCLGPTKLFGTSFNHGLIKEGTMVQVDCPGPGLLMLQCVDGIASPYNSKCFQTCPPSTLLDGRGIAVSWNISITHDTVYEAPCDPSVASLHAEVKCLDGTPRIQASYCKLNCNEGQIEQPDPEELYKYPILLSHNASVHGGEQVVSCPSHLAGRATVRCDDSVVKIVAGSCGTSNCMPSKLLSGENLLISYPQMNHAETYETDCGAGFIGRIKFRCNEGVALREWIRMNYLNQINNMVETVELCECCLTNGVSSLTVGDGQHEFAAGSDEAVGWVSAGALFSIVLFFGLYWNNYWSRYVTPKIQKSWLMRYYRERKAKNAAAARGALQAKIAASQNVGISRALEAVEDGDEESGSSAGSQNAIEDHGYENKVAPIQDAV